MLVLIFSWTIAAHGLAPEVWDAGALPVEWESALHERAAEVKALPLLAERVQAGITLLSQACQASGISAMQHQALVHHVRAAVITLFDNELDVLEAQAQAAHDQGVKFQEQTALTSLKTLVEVIKRLSLETPDHIASAPQALTQAVAVMPMLLQRVVVVGEQGASQEASQIVVQSSPQKMSMGTVIGVACGVGVAAVATALIVATRYRSEQKQEQSLVSKKARADSGAQNLWSS